MRWINKHIKELPIPDAANEQIKKIKEIVREIEKDRISENDETLKENFLDREVYKIFNLSEEEIRIIETTTQKLSG